MAEIWGAAIAVVGSVASGMAASKKAKKDRKNALTDTKEGAVIERDNMAFAASLDDYYSTKKRAGTQRGLDEFRKFSTLGKFAPEYKDTSQRIVVPGAAPDPRQAEKDAEIKAVEDAANRPAETGAKKKRGLAGKLRDPLGLMG